MAHPINAIPGRQGFQEIRLPEGQRASAPPPPDGTSTPTAAIDVSMMVGSKWWDAIPAGSVLVNPMVRTDDDSVAVFRAPDGHELRVSHWDDEIKSVADQTGRIIHCVDDDIEVDDEGVYDYEPSWAGITMSFPNGEPDNYDPDDESCWFSGYSVSVTTSPDAQPAETVGLLAIGVNPENGCLTGNLLDADDNPVKYVEIPLAVISHIEVP